MQPQWFPAKRLTSNIVKWTGSKDGGCYHVNVAGEEAYDSIWDHRCHVNQQVAIVTDDR